MLRPCKLTFDLLTLKVVSESRVTCATSVPILGLSVLDLDPIYATDRRHQTPVDLNSFSSLIYFVLLFDILLAPLDNF